MQIDKIFITFIQLLLFQLLVITRKEEIYENPIIKQELSNYQIDFFLGCIWKLFFS